MVQRDKRIGNVVQLLTEVGDYNDRSMFRGQVKRWTLLPTISRLPKSVAAFENWEVFHAHTLEQFKRYGRPHFSQKPASDIEWLVHAQHYGLPTRLLDWTTNPLKALFFAVDDPQNDNEDGVLWVLEPDGWWDDFTEVNRKSWEYELAAFFPEHLNERLIAQQGCFLSFPMPRNCHAIPPLESSSAGYKVNYLRDIQIPAQAKPRLRNELSLLGINHASMFPGLDGVAKSIKLSLLSPEWFMFAEADVQ